MACGCQQQSPPPPEQKPTQARVVYLANQRPLPNKPIRKIFL